MDDRLMTEPIDDLTEPGFNPEEQMVMNTLDMVADYLGRKTISDGTVEVSFDHDRDGKERIQIKFVTKEPDPEEDDGDETD